MVFGIVASPLADAGVVPEFRRGALSRVENLDLDAIRQKCFSDSVKQNERYSYQDHGARGGDADLPEKGYVGVQ